MKNKLQAVIVEDEKLARDIIKTYLKDFESIEVIQECSNGFEGIKCINEKNPDLVFLDIQMPKINGFEMLEVIETSPAVIFTTAFDQYAIKAFEVNAVDYLLKPYSKERFEEAVNKAIYNLDVSGDKAKALSSPAVYAAKEFLERVVIKTQQKIIIVPAEEINYITAEDDYVMLQTSAGKYLKQKTMKYFEEHLDPSQFLRIHRSIIIRFDFIEKIEITGKESYTAVTKKGDKLPVSKTGYVKLKEALDI